MLTQTGVKLLDFGLAKLRTSAAALSTMPTQENVETAQGTILAGAHRQPAAPASAVTHFSVSADGGLAYIPGSSRAE